MSKFNLLGFVFCGAGAVTAIFQSIQAMMTAGEVVWQFQALVDIFDESHFVWIDNLSSTFLQNILNVFVSIPVCGILVGIGLIFLIIGGLTRQ